MGTRSRRDPHDAQPGAHMDLIQGAFPFAEGRTVRRVEREARTNG